MNAGTRTKATQKPCHAPTTAPTARPSRIAAQVGQCHTDMDWATMIPTNAATEPTDRSMCPAMITMTIPSARMRM